MEYKVTDTTREDEYRQRRDGSEYNHRRGLNSFYRLKGAWESNALRPGDEEGGFGAVELIHLEYWAACHKILPRPLAP